MVGGVASKNAPSPKVVVPHFLFGAFSLLALSVLLLFNLDVLNGPYFSPSVLSMVHLAVLGWISMIIFGALYQLVPVVMDVKLYSEKLAKVNFYIFALAIVLFVYAFWNLSTSNGLFHLAGFLSFTSIILFSINILMSASNSSQKDYSVKFIKNSIFWLIMTASLGFVLVVNLMSPFLEINHLQLLKVHAHFGIIGWFLLLIIGVSSKLIPMFLVSHNLDERKMRIAFVLTNYGLTLLFIVFIFDLGPVLVALSAFIIVMGIASFVLYLYEAYTKRIKRILDIGMKHTLLSFIVLILPILLILIVPFTFDIDISQQSTLAYGLSIILGFITALILGQTYKTLPFIVWLYEYRGKMGNKEVPLPRELYSEKIATIHYYAYTIAFLNLFIGVLADVYALKLIGAIVFLITALLYNFNILKIINHKAKF